MVKGCLFGVGRIVCVLFACFCFFPWHCFVLHLFSNHYQGEKWELPIYLFYIILDARCLQGPLWLSLQSTHLIVQVFVLCCCFLEMMRCPGVHMTTQRCMYMLDLYWVCFLVCFFFIIILLILILPSSLFTFVPASEHWVGISRKLSTMNAASLSLTEAVDLEPAAVCVLLVLFSLACIALHSLTLAPICHLITQPALSHPPATFCFQLLADYSE